MRLTVLRRSGDYPHTGIGVTGLFPVVRLVRFGVMKSRFRFAGALVALLALSAYFAEGVWAAMCSPEMRYASIESVTSYDTAHEDCAAKVAGAPTEPELPEPGEPHGSQAPKCPLGPLGVGGSCVAASLPTAAIRIAPTLPDGAQLSLSPDRARDLLLAAALFHPPRA
jgi:hypothetical protein